ncbi:MAG: tRNA (guanosine(46)-N7)-methyltransferase TrmB [Pseudomonadota bacterium]
MSDDRSVFGRAGDSTPTTPQPGRRGIRSYVLRQGRMTNGQRRAMDELLVPHGIDDVATLKGAFQVDQPLTLEIGFGMGDSLLEMASALPERNFVGVEVHAPGVGHLLSGIEKAEMGNLKVIHGDVTTVLRDAPARTFSQVLIFFPDPWHKKKHHKRRLINPGFVTELLPLMGDQALLHVATDWEPYAETIVETMAGFPELSRCDPPWRPETKYECRGVRLGHQVTDLCYRRAGFDDAVAD